jgi:branched-chain amino acid aminotransferase
MKILSNELSKHYQMASLERGHCVFTSFISKNGKIIFLDSHIERLIAGAAFLFPKLDWRINQDRLSKYLEDEFYKLSFEEKERSYFRLTIFDDYVHLKIANLPPPLISGNKLKLTTAYKKKSPGLIPSFVKLSNYVESDVELREARLKNFDDVIYFSHDHYVTEASTSNVFVVSESGKVLTPPISSMVLDGIIRKKLINSLNESGVNVAESLITKEDLLNAREIWLTNSVRGIRFVDQFEGLHYQMQNSIFEKVVSIFGFHGELI